MATTSVKDITNNYYLKINADGSINTDTSGSVSNVNIFDSAGNVLNSTAGALDVNIINGSSSGWTNFGQSTPKQVSVSNTSTQLLTTNALRIFARISNNSSQTIYLQYGISAIWQNGLRMCPGSTLTIDTSELFQGQINAITQTGSVNIDVIEGIT